MLLQPVYELGVEMVGRLIEQKHRAAEANRRHRATRRRSPPESAWSPADRPADTAGRPWPARAWSLVFQASAASRRSAKFGLTRYQRIHLVGILKHVGIAESLIHAVKLSEHVHDRLHALAHHQSRSSADRAAGPAPDIPLTSRARTPPRPDSSCLCRLSDLQQRGLTRSRSDRLYRSWRHRKTRYMF